MKSKITKLNLIKSPLRNVFSLSKTSPQFPLVFQISTVGAKVLVLCILLGSVNIFTVLSSALGSPRDGERPKRPALSQDTDKPSKPKSSDCQDIIASAQPPGKRAVRAAGRRKAEGKDTEWPPPTITRFVDLPQPFNKTDIPPKEIYYSGFGVLENPMKTAESLLFLHGGVFDDRGVTRNTKSTVFRLIQQLEALIPDDETSRSLSLTQTAEFKNLMYWLHYLAVVLPTSHGSALLGSEEPSRQVSNFVELGNLIQALAKSLQIGSEVGELSESQLVELLVIANQLWIAARPLAMGKSQDREFLVVLYKSALLIESVILRSLTPDELVYALVRNAELPKLRSFIIEDPLTITALFLERLSLNNIIFLINRIPGFSTDALGWAMLQNAIKIQIDFTRVLKKQIEVNSQAEGTSEPHFLARIDSFLFLMQAENLVLVIQRLLNSLEHFAEKHSKEIIMRWAKSEQSIDNEPLLNHIKQNLITIDLIVKQLKVPPELAIVAAGILPEDGRYSSFYGKMKSVIFKFLDLITDDKINLSRLFQLPIVVQTADTVGVNLPRLVENLVYLADIQLPKSTSDSTPSALRRDNTQPETIDVKPKLH